MEGNAGMTESLTLTRHCHTSTEKRAYTQIRAISLCCCSVPLSASYTWLFTLAKTSSNGRFGSLSLEPYFKSSHVAGGCHSGQLGCPALPSPENVLLASTDLRMKTLGVISKCSSPKRYAAVICSHIKLKHLQARDIWKHCSVFCLHPYCTSWYSYL